MTEDGVQEETLLDAAAAIGGLDRETVRERLKQLRHEGVVEEYPSQHANPWVRLA